MKIKPLHDRVVVRRIEEEERTPGGVIIPDTAKEKPMQGEVRASLQSLVNESFEWFVDIVAERRAIPRPEALALADGRIITGRQGVDARLIDAIGGEAEAITWLETDKSIAADLPVVDYFPLPAEGWLGITRWLGQSAAQVMRSSAAWVAASSRLARRRSNLAIWAERTDALSTLSTSSGSSESRRYLLTPITG